MNEIVVAARFNGPAGSGNGGYTCGLVAAAYALPRAEVTLRRPPPLDTPLAVRDDGVYDGAHLVATAAEAPAADDTPRPDFPGYDAARAARERYAGLRHHPFPTCFSCGPAHLDGLGLAPGPVGEAHVATTWVPRADLADESGVVRREYVWAALDCPGAWALMQTDEAPIVLGRLAVEVTGTVRAGQPHVVTGWRARDREGRKHFAGTALYDAAGTPLAAGRATWVALQSGGAS
ncbi:MAG: hypothetical protein QOE45_185 [Frankiaceae bacterium]|nr:hypothetical protein [Frankiaceae bacterium]